MVDVCGSCPLAVAALTFDAEPSMAVFGLAVVAAGVEVRVAGVLGAALSPAALGAALIAPVVCCGAELAG
jgi:hypothetical protein